MRAGEDDSKAEPGVLLEPLPYGVRAVVLPGDAPNAGTGVWGDEIMSRQVRGAPPSPYAATSVSSFPLFFEPSTTTPGALHKLVDVTCDDCGAKGITFTKDGPEGWTRRYQWWGTRDLCPECSAKPEPSDTGDAYA